MMCMCIMCVCVCVCVCYYALLSTDIALLVMDKCTQEKNDRDDVSFEMSFDYEFVEDFYIEQPGTTPTATPTSTVSNVLFSRGGRESREAMVAGEGEREEGVIELRDVKIVEEGKKEDEKEEAGVQEEALQSGEDVPDIASSSQPQLVYTFHHYEVIHFFPFL